MSTGKNDNSRDPEGFPGTHYVPQSTLGLADVVGDGDAETGDAADSRPLHIFSTGLMGRIVESASSSSSSASSSPATAIPSATEDGGTRHDAGERSMTVVLDPPPPPPSTAGAGPLSPSSPTPPPTGTRRSSLPDVTNLKGVRRGSLLLLLLANDCAEGLIEKMEEEHESSKSSPRRRHTVTLPLVHVSVRGCDSRDDDDRDVDGGGGRLGGAGSTGGAIPDGGEEKEEELRSAAPPPAARASTSGSGSETDYDGAEGDDDAKSSSSPPTSTKCKHHPRNDDDDDDDDDDYDDVHRSAAAPPPDLANDVEGGGVHCPVAPGDDGPLVTCATSRTEEDSDHRNGNPGCGGAGGGGGSTWSPLRRGLGPPAAAATLANRSTKTTLSSWREHGSGGGGSSSRRSIDTFGSERQGTSRGGSADEEQAKGRDDGGGDGRHGRCSRDPRGEGVSGLLRRTCLNPRYSLRMQLFLSFGIVSAGAILTLMVAAIVTMASAGRDVETQARRSLETRARTNVLRSTRFVAETLGKRMENLERLASFLAEATRDRYVGYPDDPGYGDDLNVPFRDVTTGRNAYPLDMSSRSPLPLDWQVRPHVTEDNHDEHVQDRFGWYGGGPSKTLSTATAMYMMQGQCDPSAIEGDWAYYRNCADANNDIRTGGTVRPTSTNYHLATKAADLAVFLKPLYEYHRDVMRLGVFFANSGAGSSVSFPSTVTDGTSTYTSVGCEWMNTTNPLNPSNGPIATREEMDRCHAAGTTVIGREYNPLERSWCRDQALDPSRSHGAGPYLDAWSSDRLWLMTFGRAVYDRLTDEFVACVVIDVTTDRFTDIVKSAVGGGVGDGASGASDVALVRFDDRGTVVASSGWDPVTAGETATVSELGPTMGVTLEMYHHIKSRVNFTSVWDPADVRDAYEGTTYKGDNGRLVSASVIPIPPSTYDESYVPEFMVIMSVNEDEVYSDAFGRMDDEIYGSVMSSCRFTLVLGFIGMAAMILFIFAVSSYLTKPLNWLERTGRVILDNFGYDLKHIDLDLDTSGALGRCSPETEISALVKEFRKMVLEFSGKGTAAIVKKEVHETGNPFTLFAEFQDLYYSRREEGFRYRYRDESIQQSLPCAPRPLPHRRNHGPNISKVRAASKPPTRRSSVTSKLPSSSPIFWWIVGIIVTPLMISMITIFAFVVIHILRETPLWLVDVKHATSVQERQSIEVAVALRAAYASEVMRQPVGDLHVYSRVAALLLFDAVPRSRSFTEVITGVERCKAHPRRTCQWINDAPCDCDWNDIRGRECHDYGANDTRYLQRSWYMGPSQDASRINGDRNSTSYPDVAYSPESTAWWDDVNDMPGSNRSHNASGYETTYDRVRVISALSTVEMALYNSAALNRNQNAQQNLGTYIGFEADGMLMGYSGCSRGNGDNAKFRSTVSNGAARLAPHLCPLGKYGYDSRCRGWYVHARDNIHARRPSESGGSGPLLHVTPPYVFAYDMTAQSCSFPFVDPRTGEVVGVSLVDFLPEPIVEALRADNTPTGPGRGGFPILITALADASGADTVVGPGFAMGDEAVPISDVVLPFDVCDDDGSGSEGADSDYSEGCMNRRGFEEVLRDMRAGSKGTANFARRQSDGTTRQDLFIAYAPVSVMSARPTNHSDFQRGVETHDDSLIFSLALAVPESDLVLSFTQIEDDLNGVLILSVALFITLMVLTVAVVIFISSRVAVSVTRPINRLLDIVQKINRHDIQDDIPVHQGGSREVVRVYGTFEKLYKVIRVANSAFFSGDLSKSYEVLTDALVTFMQLDDEKAVGIANNNLGNTMLSMYEKLTSTGRQCICSMSREEIIEKGIAYFDHAIRSGEKALDSTNDECGWSSMYVVFMQQLSNRYFNRAIFLLTVCCDHPHPGEAEEQGKRDLMVAKDMDTEVVDYRIQEGLPCDEEAHFDLMLGRLNGLIRLAQQSYTIDWDVQELVDDAITQLSSSIKDGSHSPFHQVGPVGRMQQLEAALVEFVECDGNDVEEAARIGIRMLVEDEYVLPEAALICIDAIIAFLNDRRGRGETISTETQRRVKDYRRTLQRQMKAEVSRRSKLRLSQFSSCRTDSSKSMCMEAYY